jgi:hypothetical protein
MKPTPAPTAAAPLSHCLRVTVMRFPPVGS